MKKTITIIILILLLSTIGCDRLKQKITDLRNRTLEVNNSDVNAKEYIIPPVCTVIDQTPDLDKGVYIFSPNITDSLNKFMASSEKKIYCQFTLLENEQISNTINMQYLSGVDVKILIDKEKSSDYCDIVDCIPKIESEYNYLYSKGVFIKMRKVTYNYCINEDGIMFTSITLKKNIDELDEYALYIESEQLPPIYEQDFLTRFNS